MAQLGPVRLRGFPAWAARAGAHIVLLIGFRDRVLVSTQWALTYLLNNRSGRLITGDAVPLPGQPPVAKPG